MYLILIDPKFEKKKIKAVNKAICPIQNNRHEPPKKGVVWKIREPPKYQIFFLLQLFMYFFIFSAAADLLSVCKFDL